MEVEELIKIAKRITEENRDVEVIIGGSLSLYLKGINIGRLPTDIDIIIEYGEEIKLPDPVEFEDSEYDEDGDTYVETYKYTDYKIDVLYIDDRAWQKYEEIDGLRVGDVSNLIDAKLCYIENDEPNIKHIEDLTTLIDYMSKAQVDFFVYALSSALRYSLSQNTILLNKST